MCWAVFFLGVAVGALGLFLVILLMLGLIR